MPRRFPERKPKHRSALVSGSANADLTSPTSPPDARTILALPSPYEQRRPGDGPAAFLLSRSVPGDGDLAYLFRFGVELKRGYAVELEHFRDGAADSLEETLRADAAAARQRDLLDEFQRLETIGRNGDHRPAGSRGGPASM
jgi:hypothetical protein